MSRERHNAIQTIRRAGIQSPQRLVKLIELTVARLDLDLRGLTVLTEAASGPYVVTPIIAACAGASRVLALTSDSRYASVDAVVAQTGALQSLLGVERPVEVHTHRTMDLFAEADLITNLGFVRPIDSASIAGMKSSAVICLMCEAWEFRPVDLDLLACRQRGIRVLATNESHADFDVFSSCGWLCLKMLLDAQIQPHKSRVVIISTDKFGTVIEGVLARAGAQVHLMPALLCNSHVANADVLILADYCRESSIIGEHGDLTAADLASLAPALTVVQFAGRADVEGLTAAGIAVVPGVELPARRMGVTLAGLGAEPVVELHAAGLKVGEMAVRPREESIRRWGGLTQVMDLEQPCA